MTEWSQAVWICITLLLGSLVISTMVYYFHIGHEINNEVSRLQANRDLMHEYRTFNGFNDKTVYAQDCVSLILQQKGNIGVRLINGSSLAAYWCDDSDMESSLQTLDTDSWSLSSSLKQTTYTATAVQEKFNVEKVYHGKLTYGPNGEVIGVTLQRGHLNSSGTFVAD